VIGAPASLNEALQIEHITAQQMKLGGVAFKRSAALDGSQWGNAFSENIRYPV
jgi:tRNA(Glu) U13 pseudouridine synthase TruD